MRPTALTLPHTLKSVKRPLILISLLSVLLSGCRYDTVNSLSDKGGQVYRLDRWTGAMMLVDDGALTPVGDAGASVLSFDTTGQESRNLSGTGAKATFKAKWRDGKLFYTTELTPYNRLKKAQEDGGSATFLLLDEDGYQVASIPLQLSSMTGVVNDSGVRQGLSGDGKIQMSRSDFAAAHTWTINWSFPQ